jgi:hypothetical protein
LASSEPFALWNLEQEGRALLSRLGRLQSFALQETMVPAASLSVEAQSGIEKFLVRGRKSLRQHIHRFLDWIKSRAARATSPAEAQRRFTLLRLRFNVILSHFDIFSEALSQRSEADNGVWLAGLDVVARDALEVPGVIDPPPVICYLARGPGAAIRRARTRLPGGESNPVAIIRVPRERMIGTGIASSLVHEVGHQGAALLDLVASLRADLLRPPPHISASDGFDNGNVDASVAAPRAGAAWAWSVWRKWISEIVADFWSVARLGVTATSGLIGVVSLPAAFVFRIDADDPHPSPYLRVKLSAALGNALYPHPHWGRLTRMWESFYDVGRLPPAQRERFAQLEATMPALVERLLAHRSPRLNNATLAQALADPERRPEPLAALYHAWQARPAELGRAAPTLAFAALGQARLDGRLTPELESELLARLLKHWAWRATVNVTEVCAVARRGSHLPPAPSPPSSPSWLRSPVATALAPPAGAANH